uniref:Uncharacterized protein n=1 Tax=Pyramimonas obovata TaxID=1411642 RepID=A0A7S0QT02_9CHLO|mmetsp:Transcript_13372/g.28414  ORF Transcript_13372/g.28414 Transcript_13372/m.28414 type:complete len:657 (+) Transcript_13372:155-2125(+)|eukprot:CAMPEP_0118930640 /NCGR_PEP_ID=MMETSP1169-20130426/7257_1 /TAXON_ID=36882 /ORGANISM="Pyramimonas obovata, Strain CCMP722" /LENGTH=656 /DNA_ID=CAMNT_0006873025 /DNA_START=107 /DNA_END=2077 /DNA_ORIENTATION=-
MAKLVNRVPITNEIALDPQLSSIVIIHYVGETDEIGMPNGDGIAYFKGGHKYEGEFSGGLMDGVGVYEWVDGITYQGQFTKGLLEPSGKYYWPKECATYEGAVSNGKKHGQGKLSFTNSDVVYEGVWEQGCRHGDGKLTYNREGTEYYEGEWRWGYKEGFGKMVYASGNVYEGDWRQDEKNGQGRMHWAKTNIVYEGRWDKGLPNGTGEQTWLGGAHNTSQNDTTQYQMMNRYKGNFVNGKREGEGTFFYATGARYQGQWRDNMKHGAGMFTFEDGTIFEGDFVEDKPFKQGEAENGQPTTIQTPQMPVQLDILDIYAEELAPEVTVVAVSHLLLRFNTEFKTIYRHYASLRTPGVPPGTKSYMLTFYQFWRMARDCRMTTKDLTIAQINLILGQVIKAPEGKEALEVGPHNPETRLMFREFVEALVRIAQSLYHGLVSLERRFHRLITTHILPNVSKMEVDPFMAEMEGVDMQGVIEQHLPVLQTLYNHAACTVPSNNCCTTDTISCREFVAFMQELEIAGTELLSLSDCLSAVLSSIFPHDRAEAQQDEETDNDYHALDSELIFSEFLECITRCAVRFYGMMRENEELYDRMECGRRLHPDTITGDFECFLLDYVFPNAHHNSILVELYEQRSPPEEPEEEEQFDGEESEEEEV